MPRMRPAESGSGRPRRQAAQDASGADGIVAFMQKRFPRIAVRWKLHHASFMVDGKVFAFTRPNGIVLKLPAKRIAGLAETRNAAFLVMGKRTMREWVLLRYATADEYRGDGELFGEAMEFVASPGDPE